MHTVKCELLTSQLSICHLLNRCDLFFLLMIIDELPIACDFLDVSHNHRNYQDLMVNRSFVSFARGILLLNTDGPYPRRDHSRAFKLRFKLKN